MQEIGPVTDFDEKAGVGDLVDGNREYFLRILL